MKDFFGGAKSRLERIIKGKNERKKTGLLRVLSCLGILLRRIIVLKRVLAS